MTLCAMCPTFTDIITRIVTLWVYGLFVDDRLLFTHAVRTDHVAVVVQRFAYALVPSPRQNGAISFSRFLGHVCHRVDHHVPMLAMLMIDEWLLDMISDALYGARR